MGTYGLPALQVKPPEQQDLLGNLGKLLGYRAAQQQYQLQQQQIQQGQLQTEQMQRQAADQEKMTHAYIQANGDPMKTLDIAAKSGVSFNTLKSRHIRLMAN